MKIREIYIDGSCNNKKNHELSNVGGVGIIQVSSLEIDCQSHGPYLEVTSARMEVMGLFLILRQILPVDQKVIIYCDNQYVVFAQTKGWLNSWIFDYRNCGIEKKNIDLWDNIYDNLQKFSRLGIIIELKWVRGHNGNQYNELADKYADIGRKIGKTQKIIKNKVV